MAPGHSTSVQRFPPLDRVKRGIFYQHEIPATRSDGQKAIDYRYPQPFAFALATDTPPFEGDLPIYRHSTTIKTFAYILVSQVWITRRRLPSSSLAIPFWILPNDRMPAKNCSSSIPDSSR